MSSKKIIEFKESSLFIKSTIELPPKLIFTPSLFLYDYYKYMDSSGLYSPIADIITSQIKNHRYIKLNHYSSFSNNSYYIEYYKSLTTSYKNSFHAIKSSSDSLTANSIINYINFSIYLYLSLLTVTREEQIYYWNKRIILCKDGIINDTNNPIFSLAINPLFREAAGPIDSYDLLTKKHTNKFSLTIIKQNDNKT